MEHLTHVPVGALPTDRFQEVMDPDRYQDFVEAIAQAQELFEGRVVWNVNSTAKGGGVAEMLRSLLAYTRAADIDARWVVIDGNADFFRITKRIHNNLHGAAGDGGGLGDEEHKVYDDVIRGNAEEFAQVVSPDDVVIIHDPQPAGLIQHVKDVGATVLWRCHVGLDFPNELARRAWSFLIPYVAPADGYVFSREAFAWEGLDEKKITVIPPSIDAFSPKNQHLDKATVGAILRASGLTSGAEDGSPTFVREDGSPSRVLRQTLLYEGGDPPPFDARLVVQVSRWDRLKDPVGVINGFAEFVGSINDVHLIMAGPSVEAVADDPEGAEVLQESRDAWENLSADMKPRVHLACLPMADGEENAAIVNAVQRAADVVVQKSLAEGFGLTVSEAMWKARPVVASRIGGIQDQIDHENSGLLVDDPTDLKSFGEAVRTLLEDPDSAGRMGRAAQDRVRNQFLGPRHLMQYLNLIRGLIVD
jgi:trehalose synthase